MKVRCSYDELISVKELKPHPKNRNIHSTEQLDRLAKILEYQGWRYPIKVSKQSGFITSGHGRLAAALVNKWQKVPVNFQDYDSDDQEYADVQSDNAIASWAELDFSSISQDLADLDPSFDIEMLGIKDFTLEPADKYSDADHIPEIKQNELGVKLGDLFQLGEHRLLCGDSTDLKQVARLMDGKKADLWLTDPPYGVSYSAKNSFLNSIDKGNLIQKEIENDHHTIDDMCPIWKSAAENAYNNCTDKAPYYWFACQGGDQMMMMMMISEANWKVRHELIWVKNNHVLGRCDYHYKHEPILYGWKKDGTHNFYGNSSNFSVLNFDKPVKSDLHPTMKPIALIEYLIGNSSKSSNLVLDTFLGSGSTLIACEKTDRKCYGMEIDPHYCSVIIKRWEQFTGKKAKKLTPNCEKTTIKVKNGKRKENRRQRLSARS